MRLQLSAPLLILLTCVQLSAQEVRRQGFWWTAGAGGAWLDPDCEGCGELPDSIPYGPGAGFHVSLGAGGTLSPRVRLGANLSAAARRSGNRDATVLSLSAIGLFHPAPDGQLFVRGGIGLSGSTLAGGGTLIESSGVSAQLDVGTELWRMGRSAIAPYVGLVLANNRESSASISQPEPLEIGPPRRPRAVYAGASVIRYE